MGLKIADYDNVRSRMAPGDVIAFGGYYAMSRLFKCITRSYVSHCGVILQVKKAEGSTPGEKIVNSIIESTQSNTCTGVQVNRMSEVVANYKGDVWWLPLSPGVREKLNFQKFFDFLFNQVGKRFDIEDAAELMFETFLFQRTDVEGDFNAFFCSELVVAGLVAGGALPKVDSSDICPGDLCKLNIFSGDYRQLKGRKKRKISGYNTVDPATNASHCARPHKER